MSFVFFREITPEHGARQTAAGWAPTPVEHARQQRAPEQPSRFTRLREWMRRRRSRVFLSQLDAHMLKDIGITYAEAEHEANKPFWLP
jgi:uncharacterized protein YjiS (DUF1127 family)